MSWVMAILMAVASATTLGVVLSVLEGMLSQSTAVVSLGAGIMIGWFAYRHCRLLGEPLPKPSLFDKVMIYLFLLFCCYQFFWIYFPVTKNIFTKNYHNVGDLPLHLTLINHFVTGGAFWPQNPVFSVEALRYPLGVDFFTAMGVRLGVPVQKMLTWVGLAGGGLTLMALYRWGRGFVICAFLFSGGLAGIGTFFPLLREVLLPMFAWKNIFLTALVPQRGFLFAFPAGLTLLWCWRNRLLKGNAVAPAFVEGLLWGLMPLFHMHTFLFVSFIFVLWSLAEERFKASLPVLLWAVIPATVEVAWLTGFFQAASIINIRPGWMLNEHEPFSFYFFNFGLWIPIALWAGWVARKSDNREQRTMLATALFLWVLLMFVMFAPWAWDNTKLLVWAYLLMLPPIHYFVLAKLSPFSRRTWYVGLFLSGVILIVDALGALNVPIHEIEETDTICHLLKDIPRTERFAVQQVFNHPVGLCGHLMVAGHPAHIWTHGYRNQGEVEEKLRNLLNGEESWEKAAEDLQVRYVFWGYRESEFFPGSKRPWEKTKRRLFLNKWGAVYDLHQEKISESPQPLPVLIP